MKENESSEDKKKSKGAFNSNQNTNFDRRINSHNSNEGNFTKRNSLEKNNIKELDIVNEGSFDNLDEDKNTIEDENWKNVNSSIHPKLMNTLEKKF